MAVIKGHFKLFFANLLTGSISNNNIFEYRNVYISSSFSDNSYSTVGTNQIILLFHY